MKRVPFKQRFLAALHLINLPHYVCDHIFNKQHTKAHRIFVGGLVALSGVVFAKFHLPFVGGHYVTEYFGFFLHALGLTPVLDHVIRVNE